MSYQDIPQDDYRAGFEVGYRAIKGTAAALPGLPGQPGTRGNMTPFLMGAFGKASSAPAWTFDEMRLERVGGFTLACIGVAVLVPLVQYLMR